MNVQHPQTTPARAISRRSVAAGLAWSAPAVAMTATAPAFAASTTALTATNVTPYAYYSGFYRAYTNLAGICQATGGFIDTQGVTPSGGPKTGTTPDGDGNLNPNSSIGYWLETSNATTGVARIDSVTTTYTFSNPIVLDSCPTGGYNTTGTTTWTQCTTLNGWSSALSSDGKTLTMTYTKPTIVNTSTATNKTGTYLPGFLVNYHLASGVRTGCIKDAQATTITATTTMTYSYKGVTGARWTKPAFTQVIMK